MTDESEEIVPVKAWRVEAAKSFGLHNVDQAAIACRLGGIPFYVACALLEKESMGKNVWGNDKRPNRLDPGLTDWGTFSGYKGFVTQEGYRLFRHEVLEKGKLSNGVGPTQITWVGFFRDMEEKGLRPWVVQENMEYGFGILAWLYAEERSWEGAGTRYNGSSIYGKEFLLKVRDWHRRLNMKGPLPT